MTHLHPAQLLRVYEGLQRDAATPERREAAAMRAALLRRQMAKESRS